ncbi:hypothetical protein SAMN02745181_1169 [Rubritalea squalenifaciens DSM 18772]|uniref:Secreted protein n=1 Tax=Rubritalea squalenifaciens DSM 18772 TaxID=1123071 RepID=A0A1M6GH97_9BACT|nr:hypothetical protein [Rubritalea squalenifaciens]SHJ09263.1 hypothetical protein SAMN02745181_1169 [Rubritalea squalenifaciens DSM 18772]
MRFILLLLGVYIPSLVSAEDSKLDNYHYTHCIAYRTKVGQKHIWIQSLRLKDQANVTTRTTKPPKTNPIDIKDFVKLWSGTHEIKDFKKWSYEDIRYNDITKGHLIMTFSRSQPTGRHQQTRMFFIPDDQVSDQLRVWISQLVKQSENTQKGAKPVESLIPKG